MKLGEVDASWKWQWNGLKTERRRCSWRKFNFWHDYVSFCFTWWPDLRSHDVLILRNACEEHHIGFAKSGGASCSRFLQYSKNLRNGCINPVAGRGRKKMADVDLFGPQCSKTYHNHDQILQNIHRYEKFGSRSCPFNLICLRIKRHALRLQVLFSGAKVAIKIVDHTEETFPDIEEEYRILKDLSVHQNIPKLHGIFRKTSDGGTEQIWIVMEVSHATTITAKGWLLNHWHLYVK